MLEEEAEDTVTISTEGGCDPPRNVRVERVTSSAYIATLPGKFVTCSAYIATLRSTFVTFSSDIATLHSKFVYSSTSMATLPIGL